MYSTTTTLQLTLYGVNFSAANMTTLAAKAIEHSEAEINKYLSKRYDLSSSTFQTTTSIPPIVRMMSERLAEGYMWKWVSRGSKESIERGEGMIKDVISNLESIRSYKMDILNTAGSIITELSNTAYRVQCSTSDYQNTFNEDDSTSWVSDPDKLEDISDARD